MKNKKLVVVLLALVMVFSVVLSAYIPAIDNSITNSTKLDQSSSNLVDVTDKYTRAFDESIFADGVLTTATEMNALAGKETSTFSEGDEVWVIIELTGDSLVDQYNDVRFNNYKSLTDYVRSDEAQVDANSMLVKQNTLIKALDRAGIEIEYKYSYMSVLNGFAAKVKYGDIATIEAYSVVKDVIVSERYDMPTEAVVNEVDVYESGIFDSSDSPYKGEGMVVAVLDTGIEYSHEVFNDKLEGIDNRMDVEYIAERLSTLNAYALANGALTAEDVYYSTKIPFSYDYADNDTNAVPSGNPHGVHVSGIITGKSDTITGVAPKSQVLGMKVFSDLHQGAYTIDIMAALEDCILLNVDVINMSLGSSCGFQTVPEGNRIGELYDQLRTAGITMMVAAGNDNNSASGSAFGNTALTQNPDYGLVSSPASYSTTTTVASINGQKDEYISANDGETIAFFDNASNAASREYDFYEMLDKKLKEHPELPQFVDGKVTLDYITIPGLGYLYDYAGIDVTNKVVLVARGVCTFQEKALAANTVGALAIIIYNNTTGLIRMSIGNALDIPACSINKDVGDEMAMHSTGTITLDKNNLAGPFMSNFSSWGCLPDLTLDPDISGHGGNILSSITGNQYAIQSGTSMATPNLAGVALLLRQYLQETRPELTKAEITGLCNQILMSTATIAKDSNNKPVSPRKQGSGLAYLEAALNTQAYLTVDGSEFTKLSLGDDPQKTGVYELNFNLVNWGTEALSYEFDIDVMSECFSWVKDYEKWAIEEEAYIIEDSNIKFEVTNGTFANNIITVNGGQVAKITLTITLSEETKAYLNQVDKETGELIFKNGTYVEGFVRFNAINGNSSVKSYDLSLPYMAFYGSWLDAPLFDEDFYAVDASEKDPTLTEDEWLKATTYPTTPMSAYYIDDNESSTEYLRNTYLLPLGMYLYGLPAGETEIAADREHSAISMYSSRTYGLYNVYLGLLRAAKTIDFTISDYYTGKVIKNRVYNNVRKSMGQRPSFIYDATEWDKNNDPTIYESLLLYMSGDEIPNNSKFLVTLECAIDYENGDQVTNNTYSFYFYSDYESPIVSDITYRVKENKNNIETPYSYYANITVSDNHYTQALMVGYIPEGQEQIYTLGNAVPVRGERNSASTVEIDITEYIEYADQYDSLFVVATDYALNDGYYRITLPRNITDLTVKDEDKEIAINKYQTYTVTPMVTPADQWATGLVWETSDDTVAIVSDEGVIYGVGEGECIITITDKQLETIGDWKDYEAYEYYEGKGNPEYFKLFGEEGELLFSGVTRWEGKVELKVVVSDPENNRYIEANPTKIKFEGYTYVRAFNREGLGTNFKAETIRNIRNVDVYPGEIINVRIETEPWNLDLDKYEIEWKSSNETVATVNERGNVSAHMEGSVTITAKLINKETGRSPVSTSVNLDINDPFVIENYMITKYYGEGDANGVVTLPDDQYYNAIDEFAFWTTMIDNSTQYGEQRQSRVGNKKITKVIIPEGVSSIAQYAFYTCTYLKEVELPTTFTPGVTEQFNHIEGGAFYYCSNLTTINIGTGEGKAPVSYIGANAFNGCSNLEYVDLSCVTWLGENAFANCRKLQKVDLSNLGISLGNEFAGCTKLKEVVMSAKTVIGPTTFKNCTSLTTITYPGTTIGAEAFIGCSSLKTVKFTGAIDFIGDRAFEGCEQIQNVSFSDTAILENVGLGVFSGCKNLTKFTLDTNSTTLTSSNNGAIILNNDGTKFVLIAPKYNMAQYNWAQSNVTVIGSGVFTGRADGMNPTALDLSRSKVEVIEDNAFRGTAITSVSFPACLKEIGTLAFAECVKLSSVTIPEGVHVGDTAFWNCVEVRDNRYVGGIQTVTLSKNVTLGNGSFLNCAILNTVNLPGDKSVTLGESAFAACLNLVNIDFTQFEVIPTGAFMYCLSLETIDLSQTKVLGHHAFSSVAGNTNFMKEVDLSNIEEMGPGVFSGRDALEKVILGDKLKVIPEQAFANCYNLTEINLENIEEIGEYAFYGNLGNTRIEDGGETYGELFYPNGDYTKGLREVRLDNCKVIGDGAFALTPWIESVYAPVVESVGAAAFFSMKGLDNPQKPKEFVYFNSLETVDFGTADREINIGINAFLFSRKLKTITGFDKVVFVGGAAFAYTSALEQLDMSGVREVGDGAFQYSALQELNAPNLTKVGAAAFGRCEQLKVAKISQNAEYIGEYAFSYTAIQEFEFASTLTEIGEAAFYQTLQLKPFVAKTLNNLGKETDTNTFVINEKFFVEDGMLYQVADNGSYILHTLPAQKTGDIVAIKEGTVRIAMAAAYGNVGIRQIELPATLKVIGSEAFYKANISVVVFQSYYIPVFETEIPKYVYSSVHTNREFAQVAGDIVNYNAALGNQIYYMYYNFTWLEVDEEAMETTVVNAPIAVYPTNGIGYDGWIFKKMFTLKTEGEATLSDTGLYAKELLAQVPSATSVKLAHADIINAARDAYDAVPDATQKNLLSSLYSKLVAAEKRLAQLQGNAGGGGGTVTPEPGPGEGEEPEQPPVEDDNNYQELYEQALKANKSLTTAVWVVAVLAGLLLAGFVVYVFVFGKKPNNNQ